MSTMRGGREFGNKQKHTGGARDQSMLTSHLSESPVGKLRAAQGTGVPPTHWMIRTLVLSLFLALVSPQVQGTLVDRTLCYLVPGDWCWDEMLKKSHVPSVSQSGGDDRDVSRRCQLLLMTF